MRSSGLTKVYNSPCGDHGCLTKFHPVVETFTQNHWWQPHWNIREKLRGSQKITRILLGLLYNMCIQTQWAWGGYTLYMLPFLFSLSLNWNCFKIALNFSLPICSNIMSHSWDPVSPWDLHVIKKHKRSPHCDFTASRLSCCSCWLLPGCRLLGILQSLVAAELQNPTGQTMKMTSVNHSPGTVELSNLQLSRCCVEAYMQVST